MFNEPSVAAGKCCLQCKSPIHGRSDKKFCNDSCRSGFNNIKYADYNSHVKKVNQRLKNNYKVLQLLLKDEHARWVSEAALVAAGFQFQFYTHVHLHPDGALFKMVYTICYTAQDRSMYYIAKSVPEHMTVGMSSEKRLHLPV
ncbi:MAG: hypothetical protein RLZZ262_2160 [Bacteroidota bacterium]|jgi:hypothetical protein